MNIGQGNDAVQCVGDGPTAATAQCPKLVVPSQNTAIKCCCCCGSCRRGRRTGRRPNDGQDIQDENQSQVCGQKDAKGSLMNQKMMRSQTFQWHQIVRGSTLVLSGIRARHIARVKATVVVIVGCSQQRFVCYTHCSGRRLRCHRGCCGRMQRGGGSGRRASRRGRRRHCCC